MEKMLCVAGGGQHMPFPPAAARLTPERAAALYLNYCNIKPIL